MIFLIFSFACSIFLSVFGSLTFWKVQHPWDFYIPIVLFIAGFVASIAIMWIVIDIIGRITVRRKKEYTKVYKLNRWILNNGMAYIRRLALIRCKVTGKEKIPHGTRYLLVSNHLSNFDNFLYTEKIAMHDNLAFVAKKSNFKIPLATFHLHKNLYLAIDRDDLLQSLQVMKKASDFISNGVTSYAIFPEGTRSKDGNLGPFHEGVFNVAIKAKCPIVICTIKGTNQVKKRWPRITKTHINVVHVMNVDEYDGLTAKALSDKVREVIQYDLEKSAL